MPDPTTSNIVLAVPVRGSDIGTWDVPLNGDMTIIDACYGSVTTKSLSNVNVTLSSTESQVAILRFTGTLTGNVTVTLGAIIKSWTMQNNTLGAFVITVIGNPGTGAIVGLPRGTCQIYWDGTNVGFIGLGRVGSYYDYAGTAVPGWVNACTVPPLLYCNGATFSAVTYPLLNAELGGNVLPDTRGRGRFYFNDGTFRITTSGTAPDSIDGNTLFSGGGRQDCTLTTSQLAAHSHGTTQNPHNHTVPFNVAGQISAATLTASGGLQYVTPLASPNTGSANADISISNSGGGLPHNNVPPAFIGGICLIWAS